MLRNFTRLILRHRNVNLTKSLSNHVDKRGIGEFQDKIMILSNSALSRYNQIIGFSEIDKEYKKVTELQEALHSIQNERSMIQLRIAGVQSDLNNLQTEIQEYRRGEPKYLELIRKEVDVIQEKEKLGEHYAVLDKKEREFFSHLQANINMVHEKSKTHTRQWGIISTIIGATLGIIGTSISAYYRNNDIHRIQKSIQNQLQEQAQQITKDTQKIIHGYDNLIVCFQKYENALKAKERKEFEKPKSNESWAGYFKRKTVSVWRWCTFQKSSSSS